MGGYIKDKTEESFEEAERVLQKNNADLIEIRK